jgi:hypothetical protein
LAKKAQEFPGDLETELQLTAAETTMGLIQEELEALSVSDEVSVRETESIHLIAKAAKENEAYNRVYAEALPIARGGNDMEFDMYFEALDSQFETAEIDYNWAVEAARDDVAAYGEAFDKALLEANAALDVKFSVKEDVGQEALIPEVVLTEAEEADLKTPIDGFRLEAGGDVKVRDLLKGLFDNVTALENDLAKDKENAEVQTAFSRARTIYTFSTSHAESTASTQVAPALAD